MIKLGKYGEPIARHPFDWPAGYCRFELSFTKKESEKFEKNPTEENGINILKARAKAWEIWPKEQARLKVLTLMDEIQQEINNCCSVLRYEEVTEMIDQAIELLRGMK